MGRRLSIAVLIAALNLTTTMITADSLPNPAQQKFPVPPLIIGSQQNPAGTTSDDDQLTYNMFTNDGSRPHYFNQKLDHFDTRSSLTWKQRYWHDWQYYRPGGPVFLKIGGEMEASYDEISGIRTITAWAKRYGGAMINLEHRFFGQSWPTTEYFTKDDMRRYLNVEQALADVANFVSFMRQHNVYTNAHWIANGCSYAGALAAWSRQAYPQLIDAAIASSAPVRATIDFPEYFSVIERVLRGHNETCYRDMINLQNNLRIQLLSEQGRQRFRQMLGRGVNQETIEQAISSLFYDFFGVNFQRFGTTIFDNYCRVLQSNTDGIGLFAGPMVVVRKRIKPKVDAVIPKESPFRYQLCAEFGFFTTTTGSTFFGRGKGASEHLDYCRYTYGIIPAVHKINERYGGNKNFKGTYVMFINGDNDPWSPLAITRSPNELCPVYNIEGGMHCSDVWGVTRWTPPAVVQTLRDVEERIGYWLQTFRRRRMA